LAGGRSTGAAEKRDRHPRVLSRRRLDRHWPARDNRVRGPLGAPRRRSRDARLKPRATVMNAIVVHYKELALKGRNRPWFIGLWTRHLQRALADLHVQSIRSIMGRIEIELGASHEWELVRDRIRKVFGIANFSYAARGSHDFKELATAILEALGDRQAESFR